MAGSRIRSSDLKSRLAPTTTESTDAIFLVALGSLFYYNSADHLSVSQWPFWQLFMRLFCFVSKFKYMWKKDQELSNGTSSENVPEFRVERLVLEARTLRSGGCSCPGDSVKQQFQELQKSSFSFLFPWSPDHIWLVALTGGRGWPRAWSQQLSVWGL